MARGGAIGDINGDGWPDWIGHRSRDGFVRPVIFYNDGNGWGGERPATILLLDEGLNSERTSFGGGPIVGDFDNDGDADVYASVGLFTVARADRNRLLRNDDGRLQEVIAQGALLDSLPTDNAICLDYDRDGVLDIYTGNRGGTSNRAPEPRPDMRNKLYRGLGDGTFTDVTVAAGLDVQLDEVFGGSNGGMVAADFDDDGWPDLYVAVFEGENRLFLNRRDGTFADATTPEIGDEGQAFGLAVSDFGGDGRLDIFQAVGGGTGTGFQSKMLFGVGDRFIDVTAVVGLRELDGRLEGASAGDVDNDGDVDLITGRPFHLFLNDGHGGFLDAADVIQSLQPTPIDALQIVLVDWNADGHLDVVMGPDTNTRSLHMLLNVGNDNHWLRIDPVGVRSNRDGVGTRIVVEAGGKRQVQQLLGGRGFVQDEMIAHFGLGQSDVVDRLEIHWPSGEIDVIESVGVDQVVRVVEGSGQVFAIRPAQVEYSDSLLSGRRSDVRVSVIPHRPTAGSQVTDAFVDLSGIGGPKRVDLTLDASGAYATTVRDLPVIDVSGMRPIDVHINQQTATGPFLSRIYRDVAVLPARDLELFGSPGVSTAVAAEARGGAEPVEFPTEAPDYTGHRTARFQVTPANFTGWAVTFTFDEPIDPFGFEALRFAFRPVLPLEGASLFARVGATATPLAGRQVAHPVVDFALDDWQEVTLPIESAEPIDRVTISGDLDGVFHVAGLRLVSAAKPATGTAVTEEWADTRPKAHRLGQNYPNPFNPETTVPFDMEKAGVIDAAVFDVAGQRVATLASGRREAGSYRVRWDGVDDGGVSLASGVYLVRLRTDDVAHSRKMLLLR